MSHIQLNSKQMMLTLHHAVCTLVHTTESVVTYNRVRSITSNCPLVNISLCYQPAVSGMKCRVDQNGSSMNHFQDPNKQVPYPNDILTK